MSNTTGDHDDIVTLDHAASNVILSALSHFRRYLVEGGPELWEFECEPEAVDRAIEQMRWTGPGQARRLHT